MRSSQTHMYGGVLLQHAKMTAPSPSRFWGEALALVCLGILLTDTPVKGVGSVTCNTKTTCGFGAFCNRRTERCECLSSNDTIKARKGYPFNLYYCVGTGVAECGDRLCGYNAKCNMASDQCGCSSSNDEITELLKTSPTLWFCLKKCSSDDENCPENTTCTDPKRINIYRCQCSDDFMRSSIGQCLAQRTRLITPNNRGNGETMEQNQDDEDEGNDSQTLVIGLVVGFGVAGLLVVVLVVVVVVRRRKIKKDDISGKVSRRRQSKLSDPSSRHAYYSIADLPKMNDLSGTDNLSGPTMVNTQVPFNKTSRSRPGAYEEVNDDFTLPRLFSVTEVRDKSEAKNLNNMYSNPTISFNRAQQGTQSNLEELGTLPNTYNTLYDLKPTNGNERNLHPVMTGSRKAGESGAAGEYATAYSATDGSNRQADAASRGEYDELKLQRV